MTGYGLNNICPEQRGKELGRAGVFQFKELCNGTSDKNFVIAELIKEPASMDNCFRREAFLRKYTSNVHFFTLNVHFHLSNVHFFAVRICGILFALTSR